MKFLKSLQSEQSFQQTRMAHIDAGHDPDPVRRIYRNINERLTVNKFNDSVEFDCMNYLNTLAHNIYFNHSLQFSHIYIAFPNIIDFNLN